MPRVPAVLAAVLRRPEPPPEPEAWRVPVPSPRFLCPVHDVEWNGADGDCWICTPQPEGTGREPA